jgi:hypothetical protein
MVMPTKRLAALRVSLKTPIREPFAPVLSSSRSHAPAWERGAIRGHGHILTPGRYVGAAAVEDDGVPFPEKFAALRAKLEGQLEEGEKRGPVIREKLDGVVVDG